MARLIDANEFWNRLQNVVYDVFTIHENEGNISKTASVGYYTTTIAEVLKQTKTVDAVEVVHGRWCWQGKFRACSKCGSYVEFTETLGASFWKFCPYCGATMDLEVKDV